MVNSEVKNKWYREYYKTEAGKEKRKLYKRNWRLNNPEKAKRIIRSGNLKSNYGITADDYDKMLAEQNNVCAICELPQSNGKHLHVDHCHKTGVIRGLLCTLCNTGIGKLREDPLIFKRALEYLNSKGKV